jgi:hypothetical protein
MQRIRLSAMVQMNPANTIVIVVQNYHFSDYQLGSPAVNEDCAVRATGSMRVDYCLN